MDKRQVKDALLIGDFMEEYMFGGQSYDSVNYDELTELVFKLINEAEDIERKRCYDICRSGIRDTSDWQRVADQIQPVSELIKGQTRWNQ